MFINKATTKKKLLALAEGRAHKFERVSTEVYTHLDGVVLQEMMNIVNRSPSKGKTLYPLIRLTNEKKNLPPKGIYVLLMDEERNGQEIIFGPFNHITMENQRIDMADDCWNILHKNHRGEVYYDGHNYQTTLIFQGPDLEKFKFGRWESFNSEKAY